MNGILHGISSDDICALSPEQFVELLRQLLLGECTSNAIPRSAISMTDRITVKDGGEDARVSWNGSPSKTDFLPRKLVCFQSKATDAMGPKDCAEELIRGGKKRGKNAGPVDLKPRVRDALEKDGVYVLWLRDSLPQASLEKRVTALQMRIGSVPNPPPITPEQVLIYDANTIRNWIELHWNAVVYLLECLGHPRPAGLQTWDGWAVRHRRKECPFVGSPVRTEISRQLRERLAIGGSVVRLVGPPGVGKSRLALEALDSHPLAATTLPAPLHVIASDNGSELIGYVQSRARANAAELLVVEGCDTKLHSLLADEVRGSKGLRILTLADDLRESGPSLIPLKPEPTICHAILERIPDLRQLDIERLTSACGGLPELARLYGERAVEGSYPLGSRSLTPWNLLDSLAELPGSNGSGKKVLAIFSLFTRLPFDHLKDSLLRCLADLAGTSPDEFHEIAASYRDRGILQKQGRFLRLDILSLAVHLGGEWYASASGSRLRKLLEIVIEHGLIQEWAWRVPDLDHSSGRDRLARMLNEAPMTFPSGLGKREWCQFWAAIAEVAPEQATKCVVRIFGAMPLPEVREYCNFSRILVPAIQKLCFLGETFHEAASVFHRLVAAWGDSEEIERDGDLDLFGNNTRGAATQEQEEFLQLFHVGLPGTSADLVARARLLEEMLETTTPALHSVAVRALGEGLEDWRFAGRMGGPERIGTSPGGSDFRPRLDEVHAYWKFLLERLKGLHSSPVGPRIESMLCRGIRALVQNGAFDLIEPIILEIAGTKEDGWPEAVEALRDARGRSVVFIPPALKARVETLIDTISPRTLQERILHIVKRGTSEASSDAGDRFRDLGEERAFELAREVAKMPPGEWIGYLPALLEGDVRFDYAFGRELAASLKEPGPFLDAALETLAGKAGGNPRLLCGFLEAIQNLDFKASILERVLTNARLHDYAIELVRCSIPSVEDVSALTALASRGCISVDSLSRLGLNSVLSHLPDSSIVRIAESLRALPDGGPRVALDVLFSRGFSRARSPELVDAIRGVVLDQNLMSSERIPDEYRLAASIEWVLDSRPSDEAFIRALSEGVLRVCEGADYFTLRTPSFRTLMGRLFRDHLAVMLDALGPALLDEEWPGFPILLRMLGPERAYPLRDSRNHQSGHVEDVEESPLAEAAATDLLGWCRHNAPRAPEVAALCLPIFQWNAASQIHEPHPPLLALIDEFGTIESVRVHLADRLINFGSVGSRVPYLERRIRLLRDIKESAKPAIRGWVRELLDYFEKSRAHWVTIEEEGWD